MAQIDKSKDKAPAFQLYAAEFLADENVVLMTNQQRGCYIMLICYCWREGSIPDDVMKLARLCGEDSSTMAELLPGIRQCFVEASDQPGRLFHERLRRERQKQLEFKNERSEAGKRGAKARWNKDLGDSAGADGSAMAKPKAKPMANDASSSSSSSSNTPPKPPKGELPEGFVEFWSAYPNKSAKQDAIKAFKALKPNAETLALILADIVARSQTEQWIKQDGAFIPLPASYLRGKRWEDQGVKSVAVTRGWWQSQSGIRTRGDKLRVPYNNGMASGGAWLKYAAAVWVAEGDGPHWDESSPVYPLAVALRGRSTGSTVGAIADLAGELAVSHGR